MGFLTGKAPQRLTCATAQQEQLSKRKSSSLEWFTHFDLSRTATTQPSPWMGKSYMKRNYSCRERSQFTRLKATPLESKKWSSLGFPTALSRLPDPRTVIPSDPVRAA